MAYPEHYLAPHLDTERAIVDRLIRAALGRGWTISVFDGEEWSLKRSTDYEAITAEVCATDETTLNFRDPVAPAQIGRVWLIHGNGADVISDCTANAPALDALLAEVDPEMAG
jgi:hypothetical protein